MAIDSGSPVTIDLSLAGEDVLVRIPLGTFSGLAAHTVTITHAGTAGTALYFDFLELAVPTSSLPVFAADARLTLATDWDTDHSIALAPEKNGVDDSCAGIRGPGESYVGRCGITSWRRKITVMHRARCNS